MVERHDRQPSGNGKKPKTTVFTLDSTKTAASSGRTPRRQTEWRHHDPRLPGKTSSSLRLLRVVIFLLIVAAMVGTTLFIFKREERKREAREAALRARIENRAEDLSSQVAAETRRAAELYEQITAQAETVLAAARFVDGSAPGARPAAAAHPSPAAAQPDAPKDEDAPAGVLSLEELERRRSGAPGSGQLTITDSPAATPPPRQADSEIARLAVRTRKERDLAKQDMAEARSLDSKAEFAAQQVSLQSPAAAEPTLDELKQILASVKDLARRVADSHGETSRAARRATAIREEVAAERERLAAEQREREAAEERRRQIAREKSMAAAAAEACKARLLQQDFAGIMERLEGDRQRCRTETGREAFDLMLDRYGRIRTMRTFVAEQLGRKPLSWGWIQDASPRDVESANDQHLVVRGRRIPWAEVQPRQMLHFVKHFMALDSIPARERASQVLAAAIYCDVLGGDKAAAAFRARALELYPRIEDEANRLLPEEPESTTTP